MEAPPRRRAHKATLTAVTVSEPGEVTTQANFFCFVDALKPYLDVDGRVYGDVAVTCNTRVTRIGMQLDLRHLGAENSPRRIEKSFTEAIVGSTSLVWSMDAVLVVIRLVLAAVFGLAAVAKLTDRDGFGRSLRDLGVPARLVSLLGVAVPVVELGVAAALVLPGAAWWGAAAAVVLLAGFTAVIAMSLARGRAPDCNCFGRLSLGPVGRTTLLRNGLFAVAGGVVVAAGPSRSASSAVAWLARFTVAERVALAGGVVIVSLLAIQGWLLVHLMRQNGRVARPRRHAGTVLWHTSIGSRPEPRAGGAPESPHRQRTRRSWGSCGPREGCRPPRFTHRAERDGFASAMVGRRPGRGQPAELLACAMAAIKTDAVKK
jgi:uncharacterized membrane protein YphA (DoxX/SURF4 family)